MDTNEALSVFGTQFTVTYYNGSEYVDSVASYTGGTRFLQDDLGDYPAGANCLQYTCPVVNLNDNPQYITVQIDCNYSILQTSQLYTGIMVYSTNTAAVPPYQTPDWRWNINGSEEIFYGQLDTNDNIDIVYVASDRCFFIPVNVNRAAAFTATSIRCTFIAPVSVYNGYLYIYLAPPYLSNDAFGQNGIVTGTTVTTNSNINGTDINVNVDMSETNGLLGGIIDVLDHIVEDIGSLFVPEEDVFDTFENDLADLLMDTFGGVDSDMLINVIEDLLTHGATQSVTFPALNVPHTSFSLPAYSVPLQPHAVEGRDFYEAISLAIDLVCTCWVLNLIFDNLKKVVVGERVVEVDVD